MADDFATMAAQNPHYTGQLLVFCGAGQCDPNDFNDKNSQLLCRLDTIGFKSENLTGIVAGSFIQFSTGQEQTAFQQNQGQGSVVAPMGSKPSSYVSSSSRDGSLTPNCAAFVMLGLTIRPDVLYTDFDADPQHTTQVVPGYLTATASYHSTIAQHLGSAVSATLVDEQSGCIKQLGDMTMWGGVEGMQSALLANSSGSSVPNSSQSLRAGYVFTTKAQGDNQYLAFQLQKTKLIMVNSAFLPTTTDAVIMLWKVQAWGSVIAASLACAPYTIRGNRLESASSLARG